MMNLWFQYVSLYSLRNLLQLNAYTWYALGKDKRHFTTWAISRSVTSARAIVYDCMPEARISIDSLTTSNYGRFDFRVTLIPLISVPAHGLMWIGLPDVGMLSFALSRFAVLLFLNLTFQFFNFLLFALNFIGH